MRDIESIDVGVSCKAPRSVSIERIDDAADGRRDACRDCGRELSDRVDVERVTDASGGWRPSESFAGSGGSGGTIMGGGR